MSDYSKSVVYKIYKEDLPEIYIGSTKNEIKREIYHKSDCKCGGKYTITCKAKHCKTKKHITFIEKK